MPGTTWQLELMKKIKEMGHILYLVNPLRVEGVTEIADYFFKIDIFDVDSIEKYAKENAIDAVVSDECDIAMPVVAELGARLGVNTLSKDTAKLFTDKAIMREFSEKRNIKSPEYKVCYTLKDAIDFQKTLEKPVIIKPLDSNASRGVFKACSEEDIKIHFAETISYSRIEKAIIVERFVEGTEFTIDGIKTPKGHFTLAISEKKHYKHNPNIANELYFTHYNPNYNYKILREKNDKFVMSSPLEFGFTHAEYKYEDGEFYLIEIGARGGGNMISSVITPFMSGYDVYKYLVDYALGEKVFPEFRISNEYQNKAAVLKFVDIPSGGGKVTRIEGVSFLEEEPDIIKYKLYFKEGSVVEEAKNDSCRMGFYIAGADSSEKLDCIMKNVKEKFKISIDVCV